MKFLTCTLLSNAQLRHSLKMSMMIISFCFMSNNVWAETRDVNSIADLRFWVNDYNNRNQGNELPSGNSEREALRQDVTFSLKRNLIFTSDDPNYSGNALAFIRPEWPFHIIIEGNGHTLSRDTSSADLFRFLAIFGNGSRSPTLKAKVTLRNLTLSGFKLQGFDGGALYVGNDAGLTLENVTLVDNAVVRSPSSPTRLVRGGAIYFKDASSFLRVRASTIKNNSATLGGAIASSDIGGPSPLNTIGVVTGIGIRHSDISSNEAEIGGGIHLNLSNQLYISDSNVSNNTASDQGGGIFVDGFGIVSITRSTIGNNQGGGVVANAIFPWSSILRVSTSTLSGNINLSGGAALHVMGLPARIVNSTITSNHGESAILADGSINFELNNSILSGNTSTAGLNGYSEFSCPNPVSIRGTYNLLGDDRISRTHGVHENCSFLDQDPKTNIEAFKDSARPTRIQQILKPLADNGCCLSESVCSGERHVGSNNSQICPMTHGLAQGSPALDAYKVSSTTPYLDLERDQRGVLSMPKLGTDYIYKDIGAYEGFIPNPIDCYAIKTKINKVVNFCL